MLPELEILASFYPFNYTSVGGANMKKDPAFRFTVHARSFLSVPLVRLELTLDGF